MNTPSATKAAAPTRGSGRSFTRCEEREGCEREEPRDVEVEPVRQHDLEPEQEDGGERCELQRRLPSRDECEGDCSDDQRSLEDLLQPVKIRKPACVVLLPVPERERGVPVDLALDRSVVEHVRGGE